jgi:hypothetical protein
LSEVRGPNLAVYRWQVSEPFAGSDASRVNTSVRSDVVNLTARDADVRKLAVCQATQLGTQLLAFAPLLTWPREDIALAFQKNNYQS